MVNYNLENQWNMHGTVYYYIQIILPTNISFLNLTWKTVYLKPCDWICKYSLLTFTEFLQMNFIWKLHWIWLEKKSEFQECFIQYLLFINNNLQITSFASLVVYWNEKPSMCHVHDIVNVA